MKIWVLFYLLLWGNMLVIAQRQMENLGRGVVAVRTGTSSAFISWRLLGTEPRNIGFNIYRSTAGGTAVKLNSSVLTEGTNYTDNTADLTQANTYYVKTVQNNEEGIASGSFTLSANHATEPCVVVPLSKGNAIHFVWVGDLNGDGEYDYVVDRINWTDANEKIEAYSSNGGLLWTVDFGSGLNMDNISPGPTVIDVGNWDGVTVYDIDGDGKSEVIIKSANGVTFGDGKTLTYSNSNVQFISILNGTTGAERARAEIPNNYLSVGPMGCSLGIGYLNGITPSVVGFFKNRNTDGSFNRLMCAWDFDGSNLSLKWKTNLSFGASYSAHGADGHQMRILDFDGDGKDDVGEIAFVIKGEDGSLMYDLGNSGVVHGDRWHVGKLDPYRDGLQGYGVQQYNGLGLLEYYYDAGTGEVLWKHSTPVIADVGRGEAGDIDPRHPGYEVWSFSGLYNGPSNVLVSSSYPYPNFRVWWDADLLSENLNESKLEKWNYNTAGVSRLLTAYQYQSATGSDRAAPMFYGDIMGDWREEIIYTSSDYSKLVIFTTPTPTNYRLYTLAQNPEYRNCMTVKGYYQSNMLDYFLGADMATPPTPPIQSATCTWVGGSNGNSWNLTQTNNWLVNRTSGFYTQGNDVLFDIKAKDTIVNIIDSITPSSVKIIAPLNFTFQGTGALSGSTGLLKAGNGALSLNSRISYTDTTQLEEGSLFINNNLTNSTVKVYFAAILGGSGTIHTPVVLERGARLSPGKIRNTGTLTFKKDLALPAQSICYFDITNDSTGKTAPSDKIVVNGNLTISDTLTLKINKFNALVKPGVYPLFTYTGTFTGDISKIGIIGLPGQKSLLKDSIHTLFLIIKSPRNAASIVWNGLSNNWDLQNTFGWNKKDEIVTFVANDSVTFDKMGKQNPTIVLNETLPVSKFAINSDSVNYSFTGAGMISGNANLEITGKGTTSLLTTNSFTGTTTITNGKLIVGSLANAGENSSIGANANTLPTEFILTNSNLQFGGTTDISTNKGLTINGTNDTITVASSGDMTIQGLITGTANLVKAGPGMLNLQTQKSSFTGNTIINDGTLSLGDETANVYGLGSGSVTLYGGSLTMLSTESTYTTFTNPLIVPSGSTGTLSTDGRCDYKCTLTGAGTLVVKLVSSKDRTVFYGDWSAFTGTINATGGIAFRIGSAYGYANATFNLGDNTFIYHGGTGHDGGNSTADNVTIGALTGSSSSYLKDENWTIGSKNINSEYPGAINGSTVTKVGSGILTLSGVNTYTGSTSVNAGTLNVTGSLAATPVTVASGGKLSGTGTLAGTATANSGASIAPGNTAISNHIGTLTFTGALTLLAGSTLEMEINKSASAYDKLISSSSIKLGGNLALTLTGTFAAKDSFKILTGSSISGSFSSITPTNPGSELVWDTTHLRTTGYLAVKGKQTITFHPLPTLSVGDLYDPAATVSPTSASVVYTSSNENVAKIIDGKISAAGIGSATITASVYGVPYYRDTFATQVVLVSNLHKQTLTFAAIGSKTYGDAPFTIAATSDSALTPVTYSILEGNEVVSLSGNTVTILKPGTVKIRADQAGTASIAATNTWTSFTIHKAALTVKANNVTITYGQTPAYTCSMSGFVNDETSAVISGTPTYSVSTLKTGTRTITIEAGTLASTNYSFTLSNGTLTVDSALLTVKANDEIMTYGEITPTYSYTATGFVNGETPVSVFSGKPTYSVDSYQAGVHDIRISRGTLSTSNYTIVFEKGSLEVDKATLEVVADNTSTTYGETPSLTYTITGFVSGDDATDLSGSPLLATDATLPVGIYPITITQGSLSSTNYNFTFTQGELNVDKATLAVQADDKTITYGEALPSFTCRYSGFVHDQNTSVVSGEPAYQTDTWLCAGTHPITLSTEGLQANNYNFEAQGGTLTVHKASVMVSAKDTSKFIGTANPEFTIVYNGLLSTDSEDSIDVKPIVTCQADEQSAGGEYIIEVSGGEDNNYALVHQNGTLTVNLNTSAAETGNNLSKVYPNPVSSVLYINSPATALMEILRPDGIILVKKQIKPGVTAVDVQDILPGVYLVKVTSGQQVQTIQVIKN